MTATTLKAVIYPFLLTVYAVLGKILGQPGTSAHQSSVTIAVTIIGGIVMIVDIYWSHSRAAQVLNSPTGEQLTAIIEAKVAAEVAKWLAKLSVITPVIAPVAPINAPSVVTISPDAKS